MERNALKSLITWKNSKTRKPLVLEGARQVGKTWLMKEFGKKYFDEYIYFNFDEEEGIKQIFETNKSAKRIIERLSLVSGKKIKPKRSLIILDEIQECPDALNSLKYFYENSNEYCIIAAGSLLGALLSKPKSYPVGKVNIIKLYPLSFSEFLNATDTKLYSIYKHIKKGEIIEKYFQNRFEEAYQNYLIIGGMPQCVNSWVNEKDVKKIDRIQQEIIQLYENDFSKHSGNINSARILMIFRNVVTQLAKDNKKFIYSKVKKGARARDFEEALEWLVSSGIINRVYRSSKNEHPLKAYDDLSAFKIYLFDTGLLKQMAGVDNESIVLNKNFQFRGALAENFVLQQLKGLFSVNPRHFVFDKYEIDFLVQNRSDILPIEVKSGSNINSNSLKAYRKKFTPKKSIKYSLLNYNENGDVINIPIYLAEKTLELL